MVNQNIFQELAHRWIKGTITTIEIEKFNKWFDEKPEAPIEVPEFYALSEDIHRDKIWAIICQKIADEKKTVIKRINTTVWMAAASLFLTCSIGVYLILKPKYLSPDLTTSLTARVKPGGNRAYLALSSGKYIILADIVSGVLDSETDHRLSKATVGQLATNSINNNFIIRTCNSISID